MNRFGRNISGWSQFYGGNGMDETMSVELLPNIKIDNPGLGSQTRDMFIAMPCLENVPVGINKNQKSPENLIGYIYPNPSNGEFTVKTGTSLEGSVTYQLFDVTGKLVASGSENQNAGELKVRASSEVRPGFYLLKVNNEKTSQSFKVIVE